MSSKKIKPALKHYAVMAVTSVFVLLPFYWMVITSIKPSNEVMLSPPTYFPKVLNIQNYIDVWSTLPLLKYMSNSLFVSVMTTIICVALATLCGYSISRFSNRRLQKSSVVLMLLSQLIPGVLPFISFYFIMFNLNLTNTYAGLIIAYSMWGIPFCTLMIKSYFTSAIPVSLEESATIDGCTRFGIFFRIALPISLPGIVATAIFSFILAWNEFMWASVILSNNDLKPASIGIYDYIGQFGGNSNMALTMTTSVLITLPAIILFAFLQKYLISGLTAGAVKG
ncbi:multiple sugar transport system permease protein/raffinose/stachyose/melibiose transport system permease protein [Ruminiclostridium sufflavum DSM 19573]|uniref:Multiple sugar transport system permease protein/raffinose/stachyose/melibiose transport system permease protein n=1 Tax=Ruminiclostridium sufflavum DSM 19573 TaxID=1121337 RepID=A0A318XH97_9FIRM|nr:carbohydrate ABC transporter permease [Ruminiclostridium sufflavum]PYG85799.1 multiple sugar transport system permease protein/raffinose/stachyose/melibiose transport system permease protein [Ruminiclostridium sufflavum DSM 19573]